MSASIFSTKETKIYQCSLKDKRFGFLGNICAKCGSHFDGDPNVCMTVENEKAVLCDDCVKPVFEALPDSGKPTYRRGEK